MKLKLESKYKVLVPFEIELPDLTVITGLNGIGKTQLLFSIRSGIISVDDGINSFEEVKYVNNLNLSETELAEDEKGELNENVINNLTGYIKGGTLDRVFSHLNPNQKKILEDISYIAKKNIFELSVADIENLAPLDNGSYKRSIFYYNFLFLFKSYYKKLQRNKFKKFLKVEGDENATFLSDEDFTKLYGEEPWIFANRIFEEANLDYEFKSPLQLEYKDDFVLELINKKTNFPVNFENLSSGEKVIASLVFAIYNSKHGLVYPKIILMDEPDASLHPSMIKYFLKVIENVFVKEKGIKVILTTHSPTTIALSNEHSIYVLNKSESFIEKVSKDKALKILTEGVPSFSVNYENRRQVFVESENDVAYYDRLYEIYAYELIPDISLSFISSGESKTDKHGSKVSNCGQVINICETLRNNGNKFITGIIDYDGNNSSNDNIKVLGEGNRYTTENYFFDPILLAVFLLIEGLESSIEIGLDPGENYLDFENFENEKLQIVADKLLDKIKPFVSTDNTDVSTCYLVNGRQISLPKWFLLENQGHPLEIAIKKAYPGLNEFRKQGDKTLKLAIINKVIAIFPGLASIDLVNILKEVQG